MDDNPDPASSGRSVPVQSRLRHLRSLEFLPARPRVTNTIIILAVFSLAAFALYRLTLPRYLESVRANDTDLRLQIRDGLQATTARTDMQFCVLVRQQDSSGTLDLHCLATPAPAGITDSVQEPRPTLIVSVRCTAMRAMQFNDLEQAVKVDESSIHVHTPPVQLTLSAPDTAATQVIYRSGKAFLHSQKDILASVYGQCPRYARALALADTLQTKAVEVQGRRVLAFIAERAGKKLFFE